MKNQATIFKYGYKKNKLWPCKIGLEPGEGIFTPFTEEEERSIWNKNWTDLKGNAVGHDPKEGDKRLIEL